MHTINIGSIAVLKYVLGIWSIYPGATIVQFTDPAHPYRKDLRIKPEATVMKYVSECC